MQRSKIILDSLAALKCGEISKAGIEGSSSEIAGTAGEVLRGEKCIHHNAEGITFFKSVGTAVQDVATAAYFYRKAAARVGTVEEIGTLVPWPAV